LDVSIINLFDLPAKFRKVFIQRADIQSNSPRERHNFAIIQDEKEGIPEIKQLLKKTPPPTPEAIPHPANPQIPRSPAHPPAFP